MCDNRLTKLLQMWPIQSSFAQIWRTKHTSTSHNPVWAGQLRNGAFRWSSSTHRHSSPHFMYQVFPLRWSVVTGDTSLELDQWKRHCRKWVMEVGHKLYYLFLLAAWTCRESLGFFHMYCNKLIFFCVCRACSTYFLSVCDCVSMKWDYEYISVPVTGYTICQFSIMCWSKT